MGFFANTASCTDIKQGVFRTILFLEETQDRRGRPQQNSDDSCMLLKAKVPRGGGYELRDYIVPRQGPATNRFFDAVFEVRILLLLRSCTNNMNRDSLPIEYARSGYHKVRLASIPCLGPKPVWNVSAN